MSTTARRAPCRKMSTTCSPYSGRIGELLNTGLGVLDRERCHSVEVRVEAAGIGIPQRCFGAGQHDVHQQHPAVTPVPKDHGGLHTPARRATRSIENSSIPDVSNSACTAAWMRSRTSSGKRSELLIILLVGDANGPGRNY